jgi:hypothetical protein
MIILSKTISTRIDKAFRFVKTVCFGKNDVRESYEAGPYGFDSCPIPGVVAVYMDTVNKGDNVVVGYANANKIALPGESRMYSTDTSGVLKYFVYVQADKISIGTGTPVNHFTQYEALNMQLTSYMNALNVAITAGVASAGGAYTPPTTPLDISTSKTTNILTN